MALKEIIPRDKPLKITGVIRIEGEEERFIGPGRIELLEGIRETGSISKAAKKMNMSYKKAWDMIQSMNRQTIKPIVLTQTGGEKGGGTRVSPEGIELIVAFRKLQAEVQASWDKQLAIFLNS
ncbi:MAG: winged helix-turn-helix domain-containing protein [Spirosomataceae bacterium]